MNAVRGAAAAAACAGGLWKSVRFVNFNKVQNGFWIEITNESSRWRLDSNLASGHVKSKSFICCFHRIIWLFCLTFDSGRNSRMTTTANSLFENFETEAFEVFHFNLTLTTDEMNAANKKPSISEPIHWKRDEEDSQSL